MFYPNSPLSLSAPTINSPNPSPLKSQSVIKMEIEPSMETTHPVNNSSDDGFAPDHNNSLPQLSDSNGGGELEHKWSAEEVKGTLEITASSGKFWHDWEDLRSMLYFQLKQVLSEYPEAIMGDNEQNSALGESYLKLVKRMEEALFSFVEGPPFTLQRLSEILLNARTIYPKLSKLALALEKNLLVTSTLIKSTDPYPPTIVQTGIQVEDIQPQPEHQVLPQTQAELQPSEPQHQLSEPQHQPTEPQHQLSEAQHQLSEAQHQPTEPEAQHQPTEPEPQHQQSDPHVNSLENGGDMMTGDRDEVMSEVVAEVDGGMTIDMETFEDIISSSDTNPQPDSKL